ncbi:MAG: ThuA domain-containing protein [Planctomycetota bacterium]
MNTNADPKRALIVFGGWDGHTPKQSAELFGQALGDAGYAVTLRDTLDAYLDADALAATDLIVPIFTMSTITDEQWNGLNHAVQSGTGVAGFHGGMLDAFRNNTEYQWMTGAQWVAHPGDCIERHTVHVTDAGLGHPITAGLDDFELYDTEQYFCHVDPGNHVLCDTVFDQAHGDPSLYTQHTVMPYAYCKTWGKARVFAAMWGHTYKDFDVAEAKEIVLRGMVWATRI